MAKQGQVSLKDVRILKVHSKVPKQDYDHVKDVLDAICGYFTMPRLSCFSSLKYGQGSLFLIKNTVPDCKANIKVLTSHYLELDVYTNEDN